MKEIMNNVSRAMKILVSEKVNVVIAFVASVMAFLLFLSIPVFVIPGNDYAFQLSLLSTFEIGIYIILALVTGLIVSMQVYIFRHMRTVKAQGIGGVASNVVASLFVIKTCPMCLAGLFGLFGISVGTGAALLAHSTEIAIASIALAGVSLYLSCKNMGKCERC